MAQEYRLTYGGDRHTSPALAEYEYITISAIKQFIAHVATTHTPPTTMNYHELHMQG